MSQIIKETFVELLTNYTDNGRLIHEFWTEVETNYSKHERHYHTLWHLEHLLEVVTDIKIHIHDWNTFLFTLYYHDIVYDASRSDNEEESARLAEKRMLQIAVSNNMIERCKTQILATKSHSESRDSDTNYFTDADLSVLGQTWETYSNYLNNVRKEYSIYPDNIYNTGRKKVLQHFLAMDRIYKTDFFFTIFEQQAKKNLQTELKLLNG